MTTLLRGLLSSCMALTFSGRLLLPGAFEAEMSLAPTGAFEFSYQGEIRIGQDVDDPDESSTGKDDAPDDMTDESLDGSFKLGLAEIASRFMASRFMGWS